MCVYFYHRMGFSASCLYVLQEVEIHFRNVTISATNCGLLLSFYICNYSQSKDVFDTAASIFVAMLSKVWCAKVAIQ